MLPSTVASLLLFLVLGALGLAAGSPLATTASPLYEAVAAVDQEAVERLLALTLEPPPLLSSSVRSPGHSSCR